MTGTRLTEAVSELVVRRRHEVGEGRKLARMLGMHGLRPPPEIALLGKTLLTLQALDGWQRIFDFFGKHLSA